MFLMAMLILIAAVLLVFIVTVGVMGGAVFIIVFGDVIVCVGMIIWIVRKIWKGRKK